MSSRHDSLRFVIVQHYYAFLDMSSIARPISWAIDATSPLSAHSVAPEFSWYNTRGVRVDDYIELSVPQADHVFSHRRNLSFEC